MNLKYKRETVRIEMNNGNGNYIVVRAKVEVALHDQNNTQEEKSKFTNIIFLVVRWCMYREVIVITDNVVNS